VIALAAFDIAGTTVDEGGAVYRVLADAVRAAGGDPTEDQIEQWMGASKRDAIVALLEASGAPATDQIVDAAFDDFRRRLELAYQQEPPRPFPGVEQLIAGLRADGIKVALTTGFDREVTTMVLAAVGWSDGVLDAVVCIDDVPMGRPAPYLIYRAMEATGVIDVRTVLVAGDTVRDVQAGRNAGAGRVVAVRTGHLADATLLAADPTDLLDSVADLGAALHSGAMVSG
jgi:phosphonatase-like hydrolase